jgi:NitT/TauT family transport system permease protein
VTLQLADPTDTSPEPEPSGRGLRLRLGLARLAGYASFFLLWYLLSHHVFNTITLPSPWSVVEAMREIVAEGELWPNLLYTLRNFLIVFVLSYTLGTAIGIVMGRSRYWDSFFRDFILAGLTTPGLVFVFVGLMLFGISQSGRILPVVIIVTPLVVVNVVEGVQAIPRDLLDMSEAYGVSKARRVRHVLLPATAPFLFTAGRYAIAVGLRGTALVEVFGGSRGLGFQLRREFERFSVAGTLAWTLYLVIIVLLIERVVLRRAEKAFFRWRPEAFT